MNSGATVAYTCRWLADSVRRNLTLPLKDVYTDHQSSLHRDVLAHPATTRFIPKSENVIPLDPTRGQ